MTAKLLVNLIISFVNLFILSRYIYLMYHKRISPSLAMWVFFSLAVGISLFTYFAEGDYTISDNILNFADFIMTMGVALSIVILGDPTTRFNKFDLFCLGVVGLIIIFWAITYNHVITNISVQTIMVISYFPVVKRMLNQKKNTEAFSIWIALFLTPFISLVTNKGFLADIYAYRAAFCTGVLLILMLRLELIARRNAKEV